MREPRRFFGSGGSGGTLTAGMMFQEYFSDVFRYGRSKEKSIRSLVPKMLEPRFLLADTFAQTLHDVAATLTVPEGINLDFHVIGKSVTQGIGSGENLELGLRACEESWPELRRFIDCSDFIFLVAGLFGGTGPALMHKALDYINPEEKLFWPVVINPCAHEGTLHHVKVVQPLIDKLKAKNLKFVEISAREIMSSRVPLDKMWEVANRGAAQSMSGVIGLLNNPSTLTDPRNLWRVLGGKGRLRIGSQVLERRGLELDLENIKVAVRASINNQYHYLEKDPGEVIILVQTFYSSDIPMVEDAVGKVAEELSSSGEQGDVKIHHQVIPLFGPDPAKIIAISSENRDQLEVGPTIEWMKPLEKEISIRTAPISIGGTDVSDNESDDSNSHLPDSSEITIRETATAPKYVNGAAKAQTAKEQPIEKKTFLQSKNEEKRGGLKQSAVDLRQSGKTSSDTRVKEYDDMPMERITSFNKFLCAIERLDDKFPEKNKAAKEIASGCGDDLRFPLNFSIMIQNWGRLKAQFPKLGYDFRHVRLIRDLTAEAKLPLPFGFNRPDGSNGTDEDAAKIQILENMMSRESEKENGDQMLLLTREFISWFPADEADEARLRIIQGITWEEFTLSEKSPDTASVKNNWFTYLQDGVGKLREVISPKSARAH